MSDFQSYLLRWRGQVSGPFPREIILQKLDENEIGLWHEIKHQGNWLTLEEFLALSATEEREREPVRAQIKAEMDEAATPPRRPEPAPLPVTGGGMPGAGEAAAQPLYRPKSMKLFCFLGLTLGFAGVHNFYARYWGTAIAQVLLTVATCWLGLGIVAAWLWAMIELFLVHTDQRGVRMV
jgi:TM2 domain-containing membrane protein YozV